MKLHIGEVAFYHTGISYSAGCIRDMFQEIDIGQINMGCYETKG
jgi:hypothetical protein